jgi:hypothetical protein
MPLLEVWLWFVVHRLGQEQSQVGAFSGDQEAVCLRRNRTALSLGQVVHCQADLQALVVQALGVLPAAR